MTASKSGFVRHDFHATIAAASLCLTLFSLRLLVATPLTSAALVAACCVAFYFDSSYVHSSTNSVIARLASPYRALWNGSMRRLEGGAELRAEYERALGALRSEQPYPQMPGTTDIYSSDQSHLIASGNRWNPRPIFQSYSAYNAKLAEINRKHLVGSEAPDQVLIRIEPIDGHVPLSEDGPSWPELLSRYQPTALGGDLIYLAHRAAARSVTWTSKKAEEHAMGEPIALADSSSIDFVSLDIRPTLLGKMVSLLFRIDSPRIVLELRDGNIHEHRVVTKSAVAGFIVSPYVESINDVVQLYSPGAFIAKRVRTLTVKAPTNASKFEALFWEPRFTMTSSSFVIAGATDLSAVIPMDRLSDDAPAPNATVADCLGSLDLINDRRDLTDLETESVLKVDGWMDQQSATVPFRDVFVTLTDANGKVRYGSTHPTPRPDVAAYLNRPELTNAGYSATADLSKFDGPLTVGMAYQTEGRLVRCRQFAIPLTLKR